MTTMIERVARALAFDHHRTEDNWEECQEPARAAIEAMREPTAWMIWDGGTALHDEQEDSIGIYRAMISAALKEQP